MRLTSEHRLTHYRASDFGQAPKTPKPMVMNQTISSNGKGIVQGPITTTNVQNGHLVGGQALPKAPNQGYTTVNPATQFNPEDAKYLSQAANTGGVGVNDTRGRNLLLAGQSGSPLQATLSSIDDKYRAAAEAGQSVDPFAVAAEKQAAAAQFQAEESARQGQMQAARDKEAKSVAMSQNALTAKTPQGQKIQQITAIRQNVRLGKITQEQANAQIQQIQSQSAASPQSPVAAPTSPTPTAANPNASTATTPAVPGAAAVGTQEAASAGTEPVDANGNPVATTPQTPEEAGMDAAMLNLPPEAAFLAPFLQSLKTQTDKSLEENAQMALGQLATVEKTFGGIQDKLDGMEAGYKSTTEAMQSLLREAKESQEKQIAEAERDQMNRVQWQQDTSERVIMKNKRQNHEAMVAQLALNGGFGQDASLRAVAESDDHFETQLADLRTEMGYARTDLSVKFSGLKNEANQNYVNSTITNMKELQANLEKISFQGMSNKVSKMQAEQAIVKDAWEKQNTLRKDLADKQFSISSEMAKMAQQERISQIAQKNKAKDDAYQFFNFAFTSSTDPALRKAAVSQMRSAGYSLPNDIDMDADPVSFQLAAMNNASKTAGNAASDPFRFTGQGSEEKQALAASALTVIGQLEGGVEMNKTQLNYVNNLLDRGEVEKAKTHLRGLAVASLKGPQENSYAARSTIVSASDALRKDLDAIKDNSKGQTVFNGLKEAGELLAGKGVDELTADDFTAYKKSIINLRKRVGAEGDERLQRIFAQVENIASIVINERYGAAVTDGEMDRAREYIAMSGNTLSEMIIKLDEFSKFSKMQNEIMLNTKMGMPSDTIDMSAPDVNSSPSIPGDEDFGTMFQSSDLPVENGTLETSFLNGTVTGFGSKYWKPGLDVAAPKGAPIRTPSGGRVVKVVNDFRQGFPNNPEKGRKQNGGFGNQVAIQYKDGVKLQFSHLDSTDLSVGDVAPNTVVGYVGNTGNTYGNTGVHVDVTGYKPDGTLMTAQEVALYMKKFPSLS